VGSEGEGSIPLAVVLGSGDLDAALDGEVEPRVGLEGESFDVAVERIAVVAALGAQPDDDHDDLSEQTKALVYRSHLVRDS
jgi:hypothetical protein